MLREAEEIAEALHESMSVQMLILTNKSPPAWAMIPHVERSAQARAVEEVLEERIAWLQREADTAHKAASISEHNEDLANKQLDAATKRIQLAVSALVKGRYGTQEEAQEAIGKALESLKDDPA
jgi:hypothetical protein